MCPVCIAGAALIVGKATSAGGLTAVLIRRLRGKKLARKSLKIQSKENQHGQ